MLHSAQDRRPPHQCKHRSMYFVLCRMCGSESRPAIMCCSCNLLATASKSLSAGADHLAVQMTPLRVPRHARVGSAGWACNATDYGQLLAQQAAAAGLALKFRGSTERGQCAKLLIQWSPTDSDSAYALLPHNRSSGSESSRECPLSWHRGRTPPRSLRTPQSSRARSPWAAASAAASARAPRRAFPTGAAHRTRCRRRRSALPRRSFSASAGANFFRLIQSFYFSNSQLDDANSSWCSGPALIQ